MIKKVLILLNGTSPFFEYWSKYVDWKSLGLEPLFYSIHIPKETSGFRFVPINSRSSVLRYIEIWRNINRIIEKEGISFVHAHFLLHHGIISLSKVKIPLLITLYGSDVYRLPRNFTKLLSFIFKKKLKKTIFHAQSTYTLKSMMQRWNVSFEQTIHNPWGIEPIYIKQELVPKSNGVIIFLSPRSIKPLYNILHIVNSFIAANLENAKLILLKGTADQRSSYYKQILDLIKDQPDIELISTLLLPEELIKMYDKAHYTIQIPASDQVALSIVESMARGCQPILSNLEVYKEELDGSLIRYINLSSKSELKDLLQQISTNQKPIEIEALRAAALNYGSMNENLTVIYHSFIRGLGSP